MTMISGLIVRLRALLRRHHVDAELNEELQYHVARDAERNVANGMSASDAQLAARRAFGNLTIATENARDAWRWRWIEELSQDVQFSIRSWRRSPTFVLTVVATIGLGLGLLTTAFTVFDAYVLRPLAVRDPELLYELFPRTNDQENRGFSWRRYESFRAQHDLVDDAIVYQFQPARIRGSSTLGQLVSGNYFDMLGVPPALGRALTPIDAAAPAGADVIVLSHRLWSASFGGDSSIIGRRITLRGVPLTVVGVAREGFGGLASAPMDFWAPITLSARLGGADPFGAHPAEGLRVVARLRHETTPDQATRAIGAWLGRATADDRVKDRITSVLLVYRGTSMPPSEEVYQLFAPLGTAFFLVLLIACANVANMMLARGFARQREIGIRLALGADRGRLIRQLLTEAALLAVPSALAGIVVSRFAIDLSVRAIFATVPPAFAERIRFIPLDPDARLAAFMFAAAAVAAIAFGLAPALQATRPDIVRASRGDFDTELRPSRLRHALVAGQVALSVILLISAGVLLAGARHAKQLDPGIRTRDVLQLDVSNRTRSSVIERLRADPQVEAVAGVHSPPLDGGWWVLPLRGARGQSEATNTNFVSPEYFSTVGLLPVRGRAFTLDEAMTHAPVVVVSEAAAHRFWPDRSPIGETLQLIPPSTDSALFGAFRTATVIGVVRNAIPGSIARDATSPAVYYPAPLDSGAMRLLVRTRGDADKVHAAIISRASAGDSSAVEEAHSLAASFDLQVYVFRAAYWVATAVGCIALLLTLSGVYGVVSYLVWQRRKEFGIRMALGASAASVVSLVLRQSLRSASIGIGAGVVVALGLSKLFAGSLIVPDPFNPPGYAAGVIAVFVACVVATLVPSRKAATIDPVSTLRADS